MPKSSQSRAARTILELIGGPMKKPNFHLGTPAYLERTPPRPTLFFPYARDLDHRALDRCPANSLTERLCRENLNGE
jgi:hypothetical protein